MAIVHSSSQDSMASLKDSAEGQLGPGREVPDRAEVAGDVLRQADDLLRAIATATVGPELAQYAREQHHLLEISTLVGVDALAEGSPHERDGMVLIVALAISQNGEAR